MEYYATISSSGATAGLQTVQKVVVIFSLVVGSTFCMWLGDQITVKGIGNGISILIFVNIISQDYQYNFNSIDYT